MIQIQAVILVAILVVILIGKLVAVIQLHLLFQSSMPLVMQHMTRKPVFINSQLVQKVGLVLPILMLICIH